MQPRMSRMTNILPFHLVETYQRNQNLCTSPGTPHVENTVKTVDKYPVSRIHVSDSSQSFSTKASHVVKQSLHSPVYPSHLQVHRLCNSKGSQNVKFLTAIAEGPLNDWQTTNCHLRQDAVTNVLSIQPSGKGTVLQIQKPQLPTLQQNF